MRSEELLLGTITCAYEFLHVTFINKPRILASDTQRTGPGLKVYLGVGVRKPMLLF